MRVAYNDSDDRAGLRGYVQFNKYTYSTYIHTCIHHAYINIHTYMHTYMHTYIYTYIHTVRLYRNPWLGALVLQKKKEMLLFCCCCRWEGGKLSVVAGDQSSGV